MLDRILGDRILGDVDGTHVITLDRNILRWMPKLRNCCILHKSWAQQSPTAMYSTFAIDNATMFCFFEFHETRDGPRN